MGQERQQRSWAGTHRPINLTREQDAAATVAKLKRTYTRANQEITQKLNQAAKLIIEAVAVANKHGADLTDFDGATDKVREAVSITASSDGWNAHHHCWVQQSLVKVLLGRATGLLRRWCSPYWDGWLGCMVVV